MSQSHTLTTSMTPLDDSLNQITSLIEPIGDRTTISTILAVGRILAEPQYSPLDVPPADNSEMDGYAVSTQDLSSLGETHLTVSQRIPAGTLGEPLKTGTAAQIFTGAPIPQGADAVVMQEDCRRHQDRLSVESPVRPGQHIRRAGEDISAGEEILHAGMKLRPQDIGMITSVGIQTVPVYRHIKVAVFFTGDELIEPGETIEPGKIYNANHATLVGWLQTLGCEIIDFGTVPDEMPLIADTLSRAAAEADMVITSGGVSVGEEDHVKSALQQLGEINLWRVAIRPGKPIAYGNIKGTHFFGLPGNPVSLFVTFVILVHPCLLKMQGRSDIMPRMLWATADFDRTAPIERQEYLRARLEATHDGRNIANIHPKQSSHLLSSAVWANSLVIIPRGSAVKRGQTVRVIPLC